MPVSPPLCGRMAFVWCSKSTLLRFVVLCAAVGLAVTQDRDEDQDTRGLFPVLFNLASRARISANATCGERQPEVFCKLVEHVRIFPVENSHCDVCDAHSDNLQRRHPITNAIDGSNNWWQSPTLTNGEKFNHVTLTLDLGLIYQVAYVIVKAANAPRPGNWILERSLDGQTYIPWQYFAMTDRECLELYGIRATVGVPTVLGDDQVICTSRYSRLDPLEDGEIFVSLVNGRPGVFQPSRVLLDFTSARFVRLRLQKIRTLNADLMIFQQHRTPDVDPSVTRRYFYSIKDISIGGQCICYGHATYCRRHDLHPDRFQCQCHHNTGGDNCEVCLPLYNQHPWRTGGIQSIGCEACNCHGKASECVYNATVDHLGLSLNMEGKYKGGGVCLNCREYTTGLNCERCLDGFYRPRGFSPTASSPCRPCACRETFTSTSLCVPDSSREDEGLNPGDCICKPGFGGPSCTSCALGYYGYPNCRSCPCNPSGSVVPNSCEVPCVCKPNVEGAHCDKCKAGFYNLDQSNPNGCSECFCFGVTKLCCSATWGLTQIQDMNGWILSTLEPGGLTLLPRFFDGWLEAKTYLLNSVNVNIGPSYSYTPSPDIHYWLAPMTFLGNRLSSYGGRLRYTVRYTLDEGLPNKMYLSDPDVVLKGSNLTIVNGRQNRRENVDSMLTVKLSEQGWTYAGTSKHVSRRDFMTVLYSLEQLLIRATYHTAQDTIYLRAISLDVASPLVATNRTLPSVEQCRCPEGYAGLSCESCAPGWRREKNQLYSGVCRKCVCHSHATECDPVHGSCLGCKHNTAGHSCEQCLPGFYGNPRKGTENDCRPCACPLVTGNNFFAETCVARPSLTDINAFECVNCHEGYEGAHCERCAPGFYGNPMVPGGVCRRCNCRGNIDPLIPGSCDSVTGACRICSNNTEGQFCDRCKAGYFGTSINGDCRSCDCSRSGSTSENCNQVTGQCHCRPRYTGHQCEQCQTGYGDITRGCPQCSCSMIGSASQQCDPITGHCRCRPGVGGPQCDRCIPGYFGFSYQGCQSCNCYRSGSDVHITCDPRNGQCICLPNVIGQQCNKCQVGFFGIDSGRGCQSCGCNRTGAMSNECDKQTGQCKCHTGVGGRTCSHCLHGYFGFSSGGCQYCKVCTNPAHICDPTTGECVCPPNTKGPDCDECIPGSFDFNNLHGCKRCNCTAEGSTSEQCDPLTGQCSCLPQYGGFSCDRCLSGYYSFPQCHACVCNANGSEADSCNNLGGICDCGTTGQCYCKDNVEGLQCDRCRAGSFSLRPDNPKGCTECYCFLRSMECTQAPYVWSVITLPSREVNISPKFHQPVVSMEGYFVINDSQVYVDEVNILHPLYWAMPNSLLGDKTLSYNGRLDFIHFFEGPAVPQTLAPLVILRGNGFELHGEVTDLEPNHPVPLGIQFHENYWRLPGQQVPISRRLLMVVLQNITELLIRATHNGKATYAEIGPIGMEVAEPGKSSVDSDTVAYGVEVCKCPDRYSGLSCQNPGPGYFRVFPKDISGSIQAPEEAIGHVRPCQCYSHSNTCHPETGVCLNCQHNTVGNHCHECAAGYYGMATQGGPNACKRCACPLPVPSNNFSPTCIGDGRSLICTNCNQGYTGVLCEKCQSGYFGNPAEEGGFCQPCNCDPAGSKSERCDPRTGQCLCLSGISGRRCNLCPHPEQGIQGGVCLSCHEGCTGVLLDDISNLTFPLDLTINVTGVVYPWDKIDHIRNETEELRARLDGLKATSSEELAEKKESAIFHETIADNIFIRINITSSRIDNTQTKVEDTLKNALDIETVIKKLFNEIKGNISQLNQLVEKLYYNQSGLNVSAALKEAMDIMDIILARNFTAKDKAALHENLLAERLSEKVLKLQKLLTNSSKVQQNLDLLRKRLDELYDHAEYSKIKTLKFLNEEKQRLQDKIAELKRKVNEMLEMKGDTELLLKDSTQLINLAKQAISQLENNFDILERELYSLEAATAELERRFTILQEAIPELEKLYQDAWKHALQLQQTARHLEELFDKVRKEAQDPMRAARAYESIIQSIMQAEAAAKQALTRANETIQIAGVSDLRDKVLASIRKSQGLLIQAEDLLTKNIQALTDKFYLVNNGFTQAEQQHQSATNLLFMVIDELESLKTDFADLRSRLELIVRRLDLVADKTYEANRIATNIGNNIDNVLKPRLMQLENFNLNATITVENNIRQVREEVQSVTQTLLKVRQAGQEAMRSACSLSSGISDLRRKIDEARNITNSMKMSLSGDGNCVRSYRSQLAPGVTNEVTMGVQVNRSNVDMLLLLLQESPQEFIALEVRDNKVKFSWDVGGGQGSITHELQLKVFGASEEEVNKWYRIQAKRVGSIGQLKVWPVKEFEGNAKMVTERSQSGFSLINFNYNTSIFLAGTSTSHKLPPGITSGKLYGCIGNILVDNKPVGVYNFKTSDGLCQACKQVPAQVPSTNVYNFGGNGYGTLPVPLDYNSNRLSFYLEFKTFLENSRLFFVGNPEGGDFLSIDLVGGKVIVKFYLGGESTARSETNNTYNDNKWTKITLTRNKAEARLNTEVEEQPTETVVFRSSGNNTGLDVLGQSMYFGGVPSSFQLERFLQLEVKQSGNFLGCMRKIGVGGFNAIPQDLSSGVLVDITPGCKDSNIYQVGFTGIGSYVMFDGVTLKRNQSDISMSFFTKQHSALLMLARDPSSDFFYSLALTNGQLEARVYDGSSTTYLRSTGFYDDGAVHYVALLKANRRLQLLVDDKTVANEELPSEDTEITMGPNSSLYLGGAPIAVNDMAASAQSLDGCISDIIINGVLLDVSKVKQYRRADIGRCGASATSTNGQAVQPCENGNCRNYDLSLSTPKIPMVTTITPIVRPPPTTPISSVQSSTCSPFRFIDSAIEASAKTLGNSDTSFAHLSRNLRADDLRKNFNISFEFRTYFSDGLFGLLTNQNQTTYFAAQLRDGKVEVVFTFRGRKETIISSNGLADGQWHSGKIIKEAGMLQLEVDGRVIGQKSIDAVLDINLPLYIGSVPTSQDLRIDVIKHSLRGCVRNLFLGDHSIDITDTDVISSVEHCYSSVERGAAFTGWSWAVFRMIFQVGKELVIKLDFRTSQRNGVFLTISSESGDTGMTLELHDGKVKFAIKHSKETFRAESTAMDPNALCGNQWHTITAEVIKNVLKLEVDGGPPNFGVSSLGETVTETDAPLFIGGFPDNFRNQGASLSKQGFVGCIRNLSIDNNMVDWYMLPETNDIQRTACPV